MKRNKQLLMAVASLGLFVLFDWLCRVYAVDVGIHNMGQWPELMAMAGILILAASNIIKLPATTTAACLGYMLAFVLGVIFNTDSLDGGGGRLNNLWLIWTGCYLAFVAVGLGVDIIIRKKLGASKQSLQ